MSALDVTTGLKACYKCKIPKTADCFSKDRSRVDSLKPLCKECQKGYVKDNKEKERERLSKHYQKHKEEKRRYAASYNLLNTKKNKERQKKYRESHGDVKRRYYRSHREKMLGQSQRYAKEHPEVIIASRHKRRGRMSHTKDGTVTAGKLRKLFETWTGICPVCGKTSKPSLDHILPLSKGGTHTLSNLQLMCKPCNSKKGSKT